MRRSRSASGFSLIELLLVLVILGVISAIAIPSYLSQRRRSRVIGDAMSNARVIAMLMEQRKADAGVYGAAGSSATWTFGAAYNTPALTGFAANPCPTFAPSGNSQMNFRLQVGTTMDPATGAVAAGGGGFTFTISIWDHLDPTGTIIVVMNESGAVWRRPGY